MPTLPSKKWSKHMVNYGDTAYVFGNTVKKPVGGWDNTYGVIGFGGDTISPDTFNLTSTTYTLTDPWSPPPAAMAEPWNWKWDTVSHQWVQLDPIAAEELKKAKAAAKQQMKYMDYLMQKTYDSMGKVDTTACECNRCKKNSKSSGMFGSNLWDISPTEVWSEPPYQEDYDPGDDPDDEQ